MKRKSLCLALSASLVYSTLAQAQTVAAQSSAPQIGITAEQQNETSLAQLLSENSETRKTLEKMGDAVQSRWGSLQEKAQKEFSRYKIRATTTLLGHEWDQPHIKAKTFYTFEVEPAFRDGEQVRRDIWVVELGTTGVVQIGGQIRLTFSRVFKGPNAKWDAIKARPYMVGKIPTNSNDIKNKLQVGDSVRLEVLGQTGLKFEKNPNSDTGSGYAGYGREALFMVDLYKHSSTMVRARMLGLKNKGTLSLGGKASWAPAGLSVLPNRLKEVLSLNVGAEIKSSLRPGSSYPVSAGLIDFLYNFSSEKSLPENTNTSQMAEGALDQLIANTWAFGFVSLFQPSITGKEAASRLLKLVSLSESMWKKDHQDLIDRKIDTGAIRARTLFKGQMDLSMYSVKMSAGASSLINGSVENGGMKSLVTAFDDNDQMSYYLLDNSYNRARKDALLGRSESSTINDIDLLVQSNEQGTPLAISDVVVRTQIEDKGLDAKDLKAIRNALLSSLPASLSGDGAVENFFPKNSQTNASLIYQYNFGPGAFHSVAQASSLALAQKLQRFLEKHPDNQRMGLPGFNEEGTKLSYGDFLMDLGGKLNAMTSQSTPAAERMKIFDQLKSDTLFQKYILGEFFASLIPPEIAQKEMGLKMTFTSTETPAQIKRIGELQSSSVYQAITFLRTILNDRSLDMRLETVVDSNGKEIAQPMAMQGFKAN